MQIQAAVLHQPNTPLVLETLELEAPREDEILVRLVATGICHTDLAVMGRPFAVPQPIVLGHEGAGVVQAVGRAVRKVKTGDRVVMSYNACGQCPSCRQHAAAYCHEVVATNFLGQRADGSTALSLRGQPVRHNFFGQSSFATHALCTDRNVVKVPDSVPDTVFPLLGPMGCGLLTGAGAVLNVLKPGPGQSLVVFGTGAVGLAAVMAARVVGATQIIAVDKVPARLEMARELGAHHTINAADTADVAAAVRNRTGYGVDRALDTTGVMAVLRQAVAALAPRGVCGFLGAVAPGTELALDVRDMMMGGKTLRGIVQGDATPEVLIPALIELHAQGRFPFDRMVRFYAFEEIQQALDDASSGRTIKPVLRFAA